MAFSEYRVRSTIYARRINERDIRWLSENFTTRDYLVKFPHEEDLRPVNGALFESLYERT